MSKEKPLYTLYNSLKSNNYDVPEDYDTFERTLTKEGKSGAESRHTLYNALKSNNYDVPEKYENFYNTLFVPISSTSSRAKGGSAPTAAALHTGQQSAHGHAQQLPTPTAKQETKKTGVPMTAAERTAFVAGTRQMMGDATRSYGKAMAKMEYAKRKPVLDAGTVHVGKNKNVVQTGMGAGNHYLTSEGEVYDNEAAATLEQNRQDAERRARVAQVQGSDGDTPEEPSAWGAFIGGLKSGLVRTGAGFVNALQGLAGDMYVDDPSRPGGSMRTRPYKEALQDEKDPITQAVNKLDKVAEHYSRRAQPKGGMGFVDLIRNGEFGAVAKKGLAVAGESLPMTLSAFSPYTMVANAFSMAGNNYRENTLKHPDTADWKNAVQAVGSAAIEQLVEKYADPVFKYTGGIFGKSAKKMVEETVEEASKTIGKRIYDGLKGVGKDALGEGMEEVVSGFGNDLLGETLDIVSGSKDYGLRAQWAEAKRENPDASLMDFSMDKGKEAVDSFIGGALAGMYTSGTTQLGASAVNYAFEKTHAAPPKTGDEVITPVQMELGQHYAKGYDTTEASDMPMVRMRMERAEEVLRDKMGWSEELAPEVGELLRQPEEDAEKRKAVEDYVRARAMYDGMIGRVKDDMDTAITANDTAIEERTHEDGYIYPATTKVDDRRVFVVGGHVQMAEDGKGIDLEKSSDSILIRDVETGVQEMVSPSAILSVDDAVSAQEERAVASERIRQTYAQREADKIDGTLQFNTDDTYAVVGEDGVQHTLQVMGEAVDEQGGRPMPEMVSVSIDGSQPTILPKAQVQDMSDAEARLRFEELMQQETEAKTEAEETEAEGNEAVAEQPRRTYSLNDEITLTDEGGNPVRGSITAGVNEDGKFEVYTEEPIGGKKVNLFTAEELDALNPEAQVEGAGDAQVEDADEAQDEGVMVGQGIEGADKAAADALEGVTMGQGVEVAPQDMEGESSGVGAAAMHPTAMERIPKDEQGQPIYEQAEAETAWDAIVEEAEGDEGMAQTVADEMVADMEAVVKKVEKAKAKGGTTVAEKIAAEKERKAVIEQARRRLDHWKKIAGTRGMRMAAIKAEEDRKAQEAARVRKEQEEKERAAREEAARVQREEAEALRAREERERAEHATREEQERQSMDSALVEQGGKMYDGLSPKEAIERLYDDTLTDAEIDDFVTTNMAHAEASGSAEKKVYWQTVEKLRKELTGTTSAEMEEVRHELSGRAAQEEYRREHEVGGIRSAEDLTGDFLRGAKITPESFKAETGLGNAEQRMFVGMISRKGESIERLAERLAELDMSDYNSMYFHGDSNEARSAIIDTLLSSRSRGDFNHARRRNDSEEEAYVAEVVRQRDEAYMEAYGMGYEEYLAYEEQFLPDMLRKTANFAEAEYMNAYAADIEEQLKQHEDYGREAIAERSKPADGSGTEILHGASPHDEGGTGTPGHEGGNAPSRDNGHAQNGAVSEEASAGSRSENSDGTETNQGGTEAESRAEQVDKQGNPINADGTLKVNKVNSINELTDDDFENPTRNVELPAIPENVDKAIGANGKPVVIKKNIFEKNKNSHNFSNQQSRDIITNALYNTDLVGQTQPTKRPKHWVAILLDEKSPITVLEVNENKDNVEIVGWYTLDKRNLERIKIQAANEGGELLMLSSKDKVESLSTPNSNLSSADKDKQTSNTRQEEESKISQNNAVSEDLFAIAERVSSEYQTRRAREKEEGKVDTNPTEAQKEAGNYRKGHIKIDGMDVTIEQPKGSVRRGKDADGKEWESEMHNTYGYIRGTEATDGDHIDIFLSDTPEHGNVFVVDQINKDGSFDEYKVMYGFKDMETARQAYLSNYEDGWQGLGSITEVSKEEFKKWIDSSKRKTKPFAEYSSVKHNADVQAEHLIADEPSGGEEGTAGIVLEHAEQIGGVIDEVRGEIGGVAVEQVSTTEDIARYRGLGVADEYLRDMEEDFANEDVAATYIPDAGIVVFYPGHAVLHGITVGGLKNTLYHENMHATIDRMRSGRSAMSKMVDEQLSKLSGLIAEHYPGLEAYVDEQYSGKADVIKNEEMVAEFIGRMVEDYGADAVIGERVNYADDNALTNLINYFVSHLNTHSHGRREEERRAREDYRNTHEGGYRAAEQAPSEGASSRVGRAGEAVRSLGSGAVAHDRGTENSGHGDASSVRMQEAAKRMDRIDDAHAEPLASPDASDGSGVENRRGYTHEELSIIDEAKRNGTYMKAPNGEPSIAQHGTPSEFWTFDTSKQDEYGRGDEDVNARFNEQLVSLVNGDTDSRRLSLGRAGNTLRSAGVADAEIVLDYDKVLRKSKESYKNAHPFDMLDIKDLPLHVNEPIAVFESKSVDGDKVLLTELIKDDHHFIVAIRAKTENRRGGKTLEINDITTLFPKEAKGVVKWLLDGKARFINKEKAQSWLRQLRNLPETYSNDELSSAAKIVENFDNPVTKGENLLRDGAGSLTEDEVSLANDPWQKMLGKDYRSPRQRAAFAARERERMAERAEELAATLHLDNVEVVASPDVSDGSGEQSRKARAKGYYDKRTGKIVVNLNNHTDVADVEQTLLHEAVAHYGLRKLFGDHFDTFLDNVYRNAEPEIRREIAAMASRNGWDFRVATEEYLAGLAEQTDFERMPYSFWTKIKHLFLDMLHGIGFENWDGPELTDNELRYLLWRSYKNLKEQGRYRSILGEAEDVAKQYELKVRNYAEQTQPTIGEVAEASVGPNAINDKFNEQLIRTTPENIQSQVFNLGFPSGELLHGGVENKPIILYGSKIAKKLQKHGFGLSELKNLPYALAHPIAVFNNYQKDGNRSVLVELKTNNGNFLVSIDLGKGMDADFDVVSSVFGKNGNSVVNWINKGYLTYVNKEKALNYLHLVAPIATASNNQELSSAAKIVENFENPVTESEKVDDDGVLFRDGEPSKTAQAIYEDAVKDTGSRSMLSALLHAYNKDGRERFKHKFSEAYFDYGRSIKQLQDAINQATDAKIEGFENVWKSLNAKASVDAQEITLAMVNYIGPLSEHIGKMIKGKMLGGKKLSLDDVEVYMNAVHGIERNEVMAMRDAENDKNVVAARMAMENARRALEGDSASDILEVAYEEARQAYDDAKQVAYMECRGRDYAGLTALFGEEVGDDVVALEAAARDYAERFEAAVGRAECETMWELVKKLNDFSVRKSYLSGLIGKSQYDEVMRMYRHYVPLRGWHDDYSGDIYEYVNAGQSTDMLQSVVKKAYGRTSRAGNILGTMASMANTAIVQGNKNLVAQKFLNLALNHGGKSGLLMVGKQWYEERADGELVALYPPLRDNMSAEEMQRCIEDFENEMSAKSASGKHKLHTRTFGENMPLRFQKWQERQHSVRVLRNGVPHTVYVLGNPKAAQAFNGLLNPDRHAGDLKRSLMKWMRFKATMQTTLSPEFVVSNFQRDVVTAMAGTYIKYGWKSGRAFAKNLSKVMPIGGLREGNGGGIYELLHKYRQGTLDTMNDMERMFGEFMRGGGMTGVSSITKTEEYQRQIEKTVKRINRGELDMPRKAWEGLAEGIEFMNNGIENATRFAAYMTSRGMGKSTVDSVFDAKECSVNFNMKGSGAWGNLWMRRYILYANPALQALRMLGTWYDASPKRFMGTMSAILAASVLTAMLCFGGDDDDWYKLSEFNRYNFINIKVGEGYAHWSIPQEFRPVWALGQIVFDWQHGRVNTSMAINSMIAQLNNLSPMAFFSGGTDVDGSIWKTFIKAWTPTLMADFADTYVWNENFLGRRIHNRSDWNKMAPEWRKAGKETPGWAVEASRRWNSVTGGSDNRKSWWDSPVLNPSSVYYVLSQQVGGMGVLATKLSKAYEQWQAPDEDVEARNIPFVSKFWVTVGDDYSKNRVLNDEFWAVWNEWKLIDYEIKHNKSDFEKGDVTKEEYNGLNKKLGESGDMAKHDLLADLMKDYEGLKRRQRDENEDPALASDILDKKQEIVDTYKRIKSGDLVYEAPVPQQPHWNEQKSGVLERGVSDNRAVERVRSESVISDKQHEMVDASR